MTDFTDPKIAVQAGVNLTLAGAPTKIVDSHLTETGHALNDFNLQMVVGQVINLAPTLSPDYTAGHVTWRYGGVDGETAIDVGQATGKLTAKVVGTGKINLVATDSNTHAEIARGVINFAVGYPQVHLVVSNGAQFDVIGHKHPTDTEIHYGDLAVSGGAGLTPESRAEILSNIIAQMGAKIDYSATVGFSDDLHVDVGARVNLQEAWYIPVRAGAKVILEGGIAGSAIVRNGADIKLEGVQVHYGDIAVSNGAEGESSPAWLISVSNGASVDINGMKQSDVMVRAGVNLDLQTAVTVDGGDLLVLNGAKAEIVGRKASDISISVGNRVYDFRGKEVYYGDVNISVKTEVDLEGRAGAGAVEPTAVACCMFDASLRADYDFVQGQSYEVVKLPLDSSVRLGVKLYSCDNKRVDVASAIQTATISFLDATENGALNIPLTIDTVHNTLYTILEPSTQTLFTKGKVMDVQFKIVDMNNNASIILQRKVRFL